MEEIRSYSSKKICSKLSYSIHGYSSFSSTYFPENILEDKPKDQSSRWSSDSNTPSQFLMLKLHKVSIVEVITFGKFEKTHVCNLKKFKIFGGLAEDRLTELIDSGLENDNNPQTFTLTLKVNGFPFPCRYIKIVPLQSWGPSFNFSIWYVELRGTDDFEIVQPCILQLKKFREEEAIRVCLKHLRDYNYQEAFESLQKKTKVHLEHPLVSELHEILVKNGDYVAAEVFIQNCADAQLFCKFISRQNYKAKWTLIPPGEDGAKPSPRGGHQCILDSANKTLYLFGGWDGNHDLADFWKYSIHTNKWFLISPNTELEGGPSPRSCHKMCFDSEQERIFCLGRYVETQSRQQEDLKSDFYVYNIGSNSWTLISNDTAAAGGPQLLFDHQLCMDVEKESIYVFGGRILAELSSVMDSGPLDSSSLGVESENGDNAEDVVNVASNVGSNSDGRRRSNNQANSVDVLIPLCSPLNNGTTLYSGLYCYNVRSDTWTQLRCDTMSPNLDHYSIQSRVGHSMLFHPKFRKLYIFSGQRSKEYLNDFFYYDVDKNEVEFISDGASEPSQNLPLSGFTQRATIDPDHNEIFVFSGLSKEKERRDDNIQNSFWVFDIVRKMWTCVYRNDLAEEHRWFRHQTMEPCPRFAHQLVYDHQTKTHFLFGGNPGRNKDGKIRLDDFWKLNLVRPSIDDVLRQCKLMLRKLHFEELAFKNTLCALTYLQTSLAELINNEDPIQTKEVQILALRLFGKDIIPGEKTDKTGQIFFRRSQLFDKLTRFFPEDMTQPSVNLIDLVSI